jgi:DUF1009 family protein
VTETLGLIAGNRRLPFLWSARARQAGFRVAAVGFAEETDRRLAKHVDAFELVTLGQLGKLLRFFKSQGVRRAVMQGQVRHHQIYSTLRTLDWRAGLLMARQTFLIRDFRTEAILGSLAKEMGRHGIHLEPATWMMEPWLATRGHLAGPKPKGGFRRDIEFGVTLATELNKLDLGQTVVVKRMSCVAVESIEGTDACILRGGKLSKGGCTVVKLARPQQDLRFDLPVVGLRTFQTLAKAKAGALVLQAGKTLFLDKEKCLALAGKIRLSVTAI